MKRTVNFALGLGMALAPIQIIAAQENDERVAEMEREKAYYEAKAAAETAKANAFAAKVAPLTALAGEGKTALGSGAGGPEAWFLSREAIEAAALSIKDSMPTAGPIVVLAGSEALNLSSVAVLKYEMSSLHYDFVDAFRASSSAKKCMASVPYAPISYEEPLESAGVDASPPAAAVIGAIGSLLSSSTEIQGIDVAATDRLLATAVASKLATRAILPSALQVPAPKDHGLGKYLASLRVKNQQALSLRACIGDDKNLTGAAKLLETANSRYTTFAQRISTTGDSGKSPLADALIAEAIIKQNPTVLRVYVDKAGGTLVNRKNLLTAFGAPAVRVTGGLVASFVATDPNSGSIIKVGTLACTTSPRTLRQAHALYASTQTAKISKCDLS